MNLLGELSAKLTLDNKQYMTSLGQANNGMTTFGNSSSALVAKLGKLATALSVVAAAALGSLTVAVIKNTSELEQNTVAFEAMLGSAEKAKDLLETLATFAKETPFELADLQKYTKQLLAYGFASGELIPTLTTVGNIAAGLGKDSLPIIIRALGQIRAKGKLAGQEFLQLTETGLPIAKELAKTLGISVEELTGNIADLDISYEGVLKTIQQIEQNQFKNLMVKQSKTLAGIWSNIKDTFTQLTWEIGEQTGIFEFVKGLAEGFLNWFSGATPEIVGFFVKIKEAIQWIFERGIPAMKEGFQRFSFDLLTALGLDPIEVGKKLGDFITTVKDKFTEIKTWMAETFTSENLIKFYDDFMLKVEEVRTWFINKIYNPMKKFYDEVLKPIFEFLWDMIKKELIPAIEELGRQLGEFLNMSEEDKEKLKFFFETLATLIGITVVGALVLAIRFITGLVTIASGIVGYLNNMKLQLQEMKDKILEYLGNIGEALKNPIKGFFNLYENIGLAGSAIGDLIEGILGIPAKIPEIKVGAGAGGGSWATGGIINKNTALVDENGPELIYGQKGARVLNNRETEGVLGKQSGKQMTVNNVFNVGNGVSMAVLSRNLNWMYRKLR